MRRPRLPSVRPPSAGAAWSWVRARLRGIGYALEDLAFLIGRAPRAVGRGIRGFWMGMTVRTRQRFALALVGAAAATLVLVLAVPALPCQFPAGDVCPPPDDADEIVPADVLGYAHVSLDPDSDQYERAAELAEGSPLLVEGLTAPLLAQIPGPGGAPADFARDIEPWFGGQAALAVVPRGAGAERVQLLEEGDAEGAAKFADSIAAGRARTSEYNGTEVTADARGLATASVEGFLVVGAKSGVRRVIDVATGAEGTRSLADDDVATEIRDQLPPERFADAYISEDGIETFIAARRGQLSSLEPFVDAAASRGAGASLGAHDDGVELAIRSSLDPERAQADPGFFAAFPAFEPELDSRLSPETLAYVGIADPGATIRELLAQATAEAPTLARAFTSLAKRLRDLGRVDVQKDLLPALEGEAAFALQPGPERAAPEEPTTTAPAPAPEGLPQGPVPAPPAEAPVPFLQFMGEDVDSDRARGALARLQGPIARALDPQTALQAPVFDRREIEGVEAQVLRLGPTINLTYALFDSALAVATQPEGVEQLIAGDGGLDSDDRFERATDGFPDEASLIAYLSLTDLIRLAELEGLREDPGYTAYRDEIARLEALGLAVDAGLEVIATDVNVVVGEAPEANAERPVPPSD